MVDWKSKKRDTGHKMEGIMENRSELMWKRTGARITYSKGQ